MSPNIRESDWKLFKELHPIAVNRYCERFLKDLAGLVADDSKTPHDRYGEICWLVRQTTKELARAFDDKRRSTALIQLFIICSLGLLTEEELSRFSHETRQAIAKSVQLRSHLTPPRDNNSRAGISDPTPAV
jgi:hypothetical protein